MALKHRAFPLFTGWTQIAAFCVLFAASHASFLPSSLVGTHVDSVYGVARGFVSVQHQNDTGQRRIIPHQYPCKEHARSIREPYTPAYYRRSSLEELDVKIPLAYWNWNGNITQEQFDRAASSHWALKYKLIGGKLYVDSTRAIPPNQIPRKEGTEELINVAAYLFPLPDMEFLAHFADSFFTNYPLFTMTQSRNVSNTGFSLPSNAVWGGSLGPTQMTAHHACLRERYPAKDRIPMAFWRGSSTGFAHPLNMEKCLELIRVRLHLLGRANPDIMDTRISKLVQGCGELLRPIINDTAPPASVEESNRYCIVLDADGNSWSDRFPATLVHFPTPVLKQATNITSYIDHMFAPGIAMDHFDTGLTTLVDKIRRIVNDCKRGEHSQAQAMAFRMQETTRMLMDHVGVLRSMAYGLVTYHSLTTWQVNSSLEGFARVNAPCCKHVNLPPEMVEDINRFLSEA